MNMKNAMLSWGILKTRFRSVLILTPITLRAHILSFFVDKMSACDSITFLITPWAARVVPLAVLNTSGQSSEVYTNTFQLLKNTLAYWMDLGK